MKKIDWCEIEVQRCSIYKYKPKIKIKVSVHSPESINQKKERPQLWNTDSKNVCLWPSKKALPFKVSLKMHKQKHLVEVSMENTFSAIRISMYFETNSCMPSIEFTRRLHGNPVNIQRHALFKFAQGIGKYIKQIPHLSSLLVGETSLYKP